MKSYKNKTTGIVGELKEDGHLHFTRGDGNVTCHETIWFGFVENSCDWEEVVEKNYQILKEVYSSSFGQIKHKIISVIRLSDNITFSVCDLTNAGKIEAFELHGEHLMVKTDGGLTNFDNNLCLRKKAILTTFDGVEMYKGDSAWAVTEFFHLMMGSVFDGMSNLLIFAKKENAEEYIRTFKNYKTVDGKQIKEGDVFYCYDNKRFKCIESKYGQFKASKWDGKRYRTKEEVEELILMNKPCLSLNELLDSWGEVGSREYYLKSPMFFNFKKFAENKIKNGR